MLLMNTRKLYVICTPGGLKRGNPYRYVSTDTDYTDNVKAARMYTDMSEAFEDALGHETVIAYDSGDE